MPRTGSASRPAGDRQAAVLAKQRKHEKMQQKARTKSQESRLLQSLGKKRASSGRDTDQFNNEIDSFMDQRDVVALGDEAPGNNSEDDFEHQDGEVLALPEDDSDLEDEDEDDDDGAGRQWLQEEAEEKEQQQRARAIADEEATSKRWGKRRSAYYDADTRDYELQSDDEAAVEEEKEAIRLVKERAAQLQDQDFESEEMLGALIRKKAAGKKTAQVTAVDDEELAATSEVEVVAKDLSKLTKEQKLQMIAADSPELIALLSEFKTTLADLRADLAAIDKIHEQHQSAGDLSAKLNHKFQLQLNYCINIAFYLYLKAEGHPVKNHPVIERLMRVRTLLGAFEPTGKKLTRQLQALFETVGSEELAQQDADDEDAEEIPRPTTKKKATTSTKASSLASLRAELAAEAAADDSKTVDSAFDAAEKAALEAEEKQFAKLLEKKRKKPSKGAAGPSSFSEFGDISASKGEDIAAASDLNFDELLGKKGARPAVVGEKRKKASAAAAAAGDDDDDDGLGDEDFEAGAAMYAAIEQQAKKKRKAKEEKYAPPAQLLAEDDPDQVNESGRRGATNSMIKNKGLTRYRPRDQKTPRVRQRKRFERAQKKRRSQVQEYRGKTESYGGEQTGIKANVIKSRSLRV